MKTGGSPAFMPGPSGHIVLDGGQDEDRPDWHRHLAGGADRDTHAHGRHWRIIQAPMRLVDYVIGHELVHLIHRQHTAAFWAMLGKVMPDYEDRKGCIRNIGPRLEW